MHNLDMERHVLFDGIDSSLFRPLASPNASLYGLGLWALYKRLIKNQLDGDECTPREARTVISKELLYQAQLGKTHWESEGDDVESEFGDQDDASRIYGRLRDCGWLREMDDAGYRRIVYIPRLPSEILTAFSRIGERESIEIGAVCQGVLNHLVSIRTDPENNAALLSIAAKSSRDFHRELTSIAASVRDIHCMMNEDADNRRRFSLFFNKFLNEVMLQDFHTINTSDNPYRYRTKITKCVDDILFENRLIDQLSEATASRRRIELEVASRDVKADLSDIKQVFTGIDDLMNRIQEYNSVMSRRTADSIRYSLNVSNDIGEKLMSSIESVAKSKASTLPSPSQIKRHVGPDNTYKPIVKRPPPEPTRQKRAAKPLAQIAFSRAYDDYLTRRRINPERIYRYLKQQMAGRPLITTDDMTIGGLEDLITFTQMRDLINDAPSTDSELYILTKYFEVRPISDRYTSNEYIEAPTLQIRRRIAELPEAL
ncbi:hypothetical protein KOI40_10310 [Aestuariicella sp. G3-2]|uniref:Wadjet anti-phage system protein JetA family protein n=1 Tax=Pseudomaricurvus albidus TaxID=2842452 RepID=UPI001C0B5178|nr:Wadjet anti-phage system protein JetA family protein [Aestuariicella albida]MBU3070215.1 hypothetical protein [Aestuariicella albida]